MASVISSHWYKLLAIGDGRLDGVYLKRPAIYGV